MEKLFALILPLCNSNTSQKINCDLSESCENIKNCIQVLSYIRMNADKEFQNLFVDTEQSLSSLHVTIQIPRIIKRQMSGSTMPTESPERYYNRTIFITFLLIIS